MRSSGQLSLIRTVITIAGLLAAFLAGSGTHAQRALAVPSRQYRACPYVATGEYRDLLHERHEALQELRSSEAAREDFPILGRRLLQVAQELAQLGSGVEKELKDSQDKFSSAQGPGRSIAAQTRDQAEMAERNRRILAPYQAKAAEFDRLSRASGFEPLRRYLESTQEGAQAPASESSYPEAYARLRDALSVSEFEAAKDFFRENPLYRFFSKVDESWSAELDRARAEVETELAARSCG